MTAQRTIREQLLLTGAKNLREFGYSDVKPEDIMGEYLLRQFFRGMLTDDENCNLSRDVEAVRLELVAEIDALDAKKTAKKKSKKRGDTKR